MSKTNTRFCHSNSATAATKKAITERWRPKSREKKKIKRLLTNWPLTMQLCANAKQTKICTGNQRYARSYSIDERREIRRFTATTNIVLLETPKLPERTPRKFIRRTLLTFHVIIIRHWTLALVISESSHSNNNKKWIIFNLFMIGSWTERTKKESFLCCTILSLSNCWHRCVRIDAFLPRPFSLFLSLLRSFIDFVFV